jgi:hypothetical protein
MVRFLDNSSQGYVTTAQLMDCFKSECQNSQQQQTTASVSRKNSRTESLPQPSPKQQQQQQREDQEKEKQQEEATEGDKAIEEDDSDPKLLSHSPAKPNLATSLSEEVIDWDTHPLPEDGIWERRYDKRTGKVPI